VRRARRVAAGTLLLVLGSFAAADPAPPIRSRRRASPSPPASPVFADEDARWADAARTAWAYVRAHASARTGLVSAVGTYGYVTAWDIGSTLAALSCARELDLVDEPAYRAHMTRLLATLRELPLFEGAVFNKNYSVRRGTTAGRQDQRSDSGRGWSAVDVGRLLLWLKIVAERDGEAAEPARAVARRVDAARVVRGGELWGAQRRPDGRLLEYQEGRIGYEQYAARGFEAWGIRAEHAARIDRAAVPLRLFGQELAADVRGRDLLTSEPFVLMGLETGWKAAEEPLARALLAAQEERHRRTGQVTIVSEDAIPRAPHYFYYYCVYAQGRAFQVAVHDNRAVLDGPRWISTKAAFAWAALVPGDYTARALRAVEAARTARGWDSGVYEGDGRTTGAANINTQAVVLEAALYRKRGRPFLPN
jgi:hypothetical protein